MGPRASPGAGGRPTVRDNSGPTDSKFKQIELETFVAGGHVAATQPISMGWVAAKGPPSRGITWIGCSRFGSDWSCLGSLWLAAERRLLQNLNIFTGLAGVLTTTSRIGRPRLGLRFVELRPGEGRAPREKPMTSRPQTPARQLDMDTAAATTARCTLKTEDPSRGPRRVHFTAPGEGFGLEVAPRIRRGASPKA